MKNRVTKQPGGAHRETITDREASLSFNRFVRFYGCLMVIFLLFVLLQGGPLEFWSVLDFVFVLIAISWIFWSYIREKRLRERVIAAQGKLCRHCLYDLTGLSDKHACPECGQAYDMEELIGKWRDTFSLYEDWNDARHSRWLSKRASTHETRHLPSTKVTREDCGGYLPAIVHARKKWFFITGPGGTIHVYFILVFGYPILWELLHRHPKQPLMMLFHPELSFADSHNGDWILWMFVPTFILLIGLMLIEDRRWKKLYRMVCDSKGRLCEHCTCDLTGLPERYHCPECGKPYDIARTIRKWQRVRFLSFPAWRPSKQPAIDVDRGMAD